MPAKPRNNRVELRLTELEKKDWAEAAGGVRRLSEWIRAVCNARVAELADAAASSTAAERREGSIPSPSIKPVTTQIMSQGEPIIVAKPVIVEDAIRRSIGDQAHRESRSLPATEAVPGADSSRPGSRGASGAGASAPASSQACPREWAHRPGAYCGACKRVIAK